MQHSWRIWLLTWTKVVVINNTGRHFFIVIHIQERGKKALDRAVKIINFTQPQFLSTSLFNIVMKKYVCCACCIPKVMAISLCNCWELEHSLLFQNEILFLLERSYGYSDLSIWQTFSQKNEVSLSLQGKQLTVFVANDKNWAFKLKSEFWKHVSATINLTASILKDRTGYIICRPQCKRKI